MCFLVVFVLSKKHKSNKRGTQTEHTRNTDRTHAEQLPMRHSKRLKKGPFENLILRLNDVGVGGIILDTFQCLDEDNPIEAIRHATTRLEWKVFEEGVQVEQKGGPYEKSGGLVELSCANVNELLGKYGLPLVPVCTSLCGLAIVASLNFALISNNDSMPVHMDIACTDTVRNLNLKCVLYDKNQTFELLKQGVHDNTIKVTACVQACEGNIIMLRSDRLHHVNNANNMDQVGCSLAHQFLLNEDNQQNEYVIYYYLQGAPKVFRTLLVEDRKLRLSINRHSAAITMGVGDSELNNALFLSKLQESLTV